MFGAPTASPQPHADKYGWEMAQAGGLWGTAYGIIAHVQEQRARSPCFVSRDRASAQPADARLVRLQRGARQECPQCG